MSGANDTQVRRVASSERIVATASIHDEVAFPLSLRDVQRPQLSRFGPREELESKRVRRWAEVGSSEKLDRRGRTTTSPSRELGAP